MASGKSELIETAVLVLGTISSQEGAIGAITPHLEQIIPFLVQFTNNEFPILRSTSLWTLSKYTDWIVQNPQASADYFKLLCQKMIDKD